MTSNPDVDHSGDYSGSTVVSTVGLQWQYSGVYSGTTVAGMGTVVTTVAGTGTVVTTVAVTVVTVAVTVVTVRSTVVAWTRTCTTGTHHGPHLPRTPHYPGHPPTTTECAVSRCMSGTQPNDTRARTRMSVFRKKVTNGCFNKRVSVSFRGFTTRLLMTVWYPNPVINDCLVPKPGYLVSITSNPGIWCQ